MKQLLQWIWPGWIALLFCTSSAIAAETIKGKVEHVAPEQSELVVKDKDGKEWTFHLACDIRVQATGSRKRR